MSAVPALRASKRRIAESLDVAAPARFALAYVSNALLEGLPNVPAQLRLGVPLSAIAPSFQIEKTVDVDVTPLRGENGEPSLQIAWRPSGSGPFPRFLGTLDARETSAERCTLTLRGTYEPPGFCAGALFDAVFGRRAARATLRALLADFRRGIERDYVQRSD